MPSDRGAHARDSRHELAAVYALDALDEGERRRFARHLARCEACTAEVRQFQEVATSLAYAAAAEPPPGLRERVMAAAGQTRQLPPESALARRLRTLRPPLPAAGRGSSGGRSSRGRTSSGGWVPRLALGATAVAVAAVVVLAVMLTSTRQQLDSTRAQSQAIAAVLAAPDVTAVNGPVSTGGVANVVLSASRGELVVSTRGLAALPADKTYEMWLIGPSASQASVIRAAGLLPGEVAGQTSPVLASGLTAGDKLGLTIEPAGGSRQPTTTPILLLGLTKT